MSKYANYDKIAETYDNLRFATGVETIASIVSGLLKKNAQEIVLLDAGCGTGNYSLGFLENGIGSVTMIDASQGMLQKAREKVQNYGDKVKEVKQHILPTLPYPDGTFDVVTLIQVVHHLDTYHLEDEAANRDTTKDCSNRYPNLSIVLKEAHRVLKPHGVLVMDHSFQHNIDASWLILAPKALSVFKKAHIPEGDLISMLQMENYQNIFYVSRPGCSVTKTGTFSNPECVLDAKFRNSCSEWQYVERTGELPGILELLTKKKEEGKLNEYVHEISKLYRVVGETTLVFAQKVRL